MGDKNTLEPGARANPLFTSYDEFGMHPERGFLPAPDPPEFLPEDFSPWDRAARELPKLLITGKVRTHLVELPILLSFCRRTTLRRRSIRSKFQSLKTC